MGPLSTFLFSSSPSSLCCGGGVSVCFTTLSKCETILSSQAIQNKKAGSRPDRAYGLQFAEPWFTGHRDFQIYLGGDLGKCVWKWIPGVGQKAETEPGWGWTPEQVWPLPHQCTPPPDSALEPTTACLLDRLNPGLNRTLSE